jgi:asparaginyl-tRNA synthetase
MLNVKALYVALEKGQLKSKLIKLQGWVKTNRNNGTIGFIEFNDGSAFKGVQIVYEKTKINNFMAVDKLRTGAAIEVHGTIILTPEMKQPFEVHAQEIIVIGDVAEDYPLQKKRHTPEFLREIAHLRPRTNTHSALFRLRSELTYAITKVSLR